MSRSALNCIVLVALLASCSSLAGAEAYQPADDDEVLETLPRSILESWNETTTLRRELQSNPNNAKLASEVASRYLAAGNREGDPRYYGYACSALQPWWEADDAPVNILRLRAKLKEKDHRYHEALGDLQNVIEQDPHNVQAWVEIANIYRVVGNYKESLRACEQLSQIAGPERTLLCRIPIQAATGNATEAYESLVELAPEAKKRWPAAMQWVLTMQSQIACALGRSSAADSHFREGLQNDPTDKYMIRAYADFLLDQDRPAEALKITREHVNDNGTLLRAAIAAQRSGEYTLANLWTAQLERRFEEIRLRGDQPHGRFEARYYLEIKHDPEPALQIAINNWQKQKEIRDSRILLEAAIGAGQSSAAKPVVEFLRKHGTENVVFDRLLKQLEGLL